MYVIYYDAVGRIIQTGHGVTKLEADITSNLINLPYLEEETVVDIDKSAVVNGSVVTRPKIEFPETHTIAASTDWIVPDVPEGTVVEIDGTEAGVVDATGLTLAFELAGLWQVQLRPPFPWLEASCEVTVT